MKQNKRQNQCTKRKIATLHTKQRNNEDYNNNYRRKVDPWKINDDYKLSARLE